MRYRLAISALVVASLFGATTIASAQMQSAPGASSEGKVGTDSTKSNLKPGTTTGSATTGPVTRALRATRPPTMTPASVAENNGFSR
jgi:hypothetical protein